MKNRYLFLFLIAFSISLSSHAQVVYHFLYKSPQSGDTVTFDAFFIQQDNGSGSIRINYIKTPGNTKTTVEMEFQQEFATDNNGLIDTSWIICRGTNPIVKIGDKKAKTAPLAYWFKINPETGLYDPWAVSVVNMNRAPEQNNFLAATLVGDQSEMRALVGSFFLPTEPFYKNLFGIKKRGGELLSPEEKATKIHLLIVANTDDTSVGNSAMLDLRRAIKTFKYVAKALTIENNIIVDTVYGERYNRTNVLNAINKINPQKGKDIVIFYYSGHGFTNPKQPRKTFPFIDLLYPFQKPRPEPRDSSLNIEDIYTMIKQKGARLNLVISDCCNNRIEDKPIKKEPSPGQRGDIDLTKWNKENVKKLFIVDKPLSILATAASKGERAASNDKYGGFYSNNFLLSLTSHFSYDKITPVWPQVLALAQKQTIWQADHTYCPEEKSLCHQTPPPPKVN